MRKWLILASYSGATFLNGVAWVTLVPIADKAMSYYNISEEELTLYCYIYSFVSLLLAPVSTWLITKSFFLSLHIIWSVSLSGCILRYFAMQNYWISFIGQTLIATGNMLVLSSCSTLASIWFPQSQIILATSIATSLNFIGMGFGFVYMSYFNNISDMMFMQLIFASGFFVFNIIVLEKDLKKEKQLSYFEGMRVGLRDKTLVTLAMCAGSGLGVSYAFISTLGLLLIHENYSARETGWVGFTFLISGLFGSFISSYTAEVKGNTKKPLMIFLILSIITSMSFAVMLDYREISILFVGVFGASITGMLPLSIKSCIDYLPTIHESISTNMIYLTADICSCIYTYPILFCKRLTGFSGFFLASSIIFLSFLYLFIVVKRIKPERLSRMATSLTIIIK